MSFFINIVLLINYTSFMKKIIAILLTLILLAGGIVEAQREKQVYSTGNPSSFLPVDQSLRFNNIRERDTDNITLLIPKPHDLAVIAINPLFIASGTTVTPVVTVKNRGMNTETTWSVTLTDGGSYTSTVNGTSIATTHTLDLNMAEWTPVSGEYTLTATVSLADDDNISNNELEVTVQVIEPITAFAWNVYQSEAGSPTAKGPVNILLPTGTLSQIAVDEDRFITAADYVKGELYGIRYGKILCQLVKINATTGIITTIGGGGPNLTGFAYDKIENVTYAMDFNGVLYTIKLENGALTRIGGDYSAAIALACSGNGTLYAISSLYDNFAMIDKTTGAATTIGNLGVNLNYAQDIAYDRDNNILYGTLFLDDSLIGGLYVINTTTGAATLIANLGDLFAGLAIPYDYTVGIREEDPNQVKIYPNPSDGFIHLDLDENCTDCYVEVFNLLGVSVYSTTISESMTIDLSNNPAGIYFLSLRNKESVLGVKKVIIK